MPGRSPHIAGSPSTYLRAGNLRGASPPPTNTTSALRHAQSRRRRPRSPPPDRRSRHQGGSIPMSTSGSIPVSAKACIVGPFLRKIQRAIDERMTVARNVGSEDSNLTVRDLACGTSVLPGHSARRLALFEKAGLVDHENRIVIRQMLDDIVADDIAQAISIPIPATDRKSVV